MRRFAAILASALVVMMLATTGIVAQERLARNQRLSYNVGSEPATLDPALSTGVPEAIVELSCFEGLTRMDANNIPGLRSQRAGPSAMMGLCTFKLRQAKWNNGEPVTAHDFEWSWKRSTRDRCSACQRTHQER